MLLEFLISSLIKTNSSQVISESIKTLEIKTSMLFNLDFASNTILSRFFYSFLIIGLYFLIPAVIVQIFNPIAELLILTGIIRNEMKQK